MEENKKKTDNDTQIYEVGYHLLPTVEEENLAEEAGKIQTIILDNGGDVISKDGPSLRLLSYPITKRIEAKKLNFDKSYFGWIKFEIARPRISDIKNKVKNLPNLLRFIVIKTERENTLHIPKIPIFRREDAKAERSKEPVERAKISETEIDKSIEELLIGEN